MDLQTELAPFFDREPPQRPVEERLRAGRRALRRRRVAIGALGLAVVAGLGTTYAVSGGGDLATDPRLTAVAPTPSAGTASRFYDLDSPELQAEQDRFRGFSIDEVTGTVTAAGGGVLRDVVALEPEAGGLGAVGVDVVGPGGDEMWHYVTWETSGGFEAADRATPGITFGAWLEEMRAMDDPNNLGSAAVPAEQSGGVPARSVVDTDELGAYTLPPGVELVSEVANPLQLEAPYTSAGLELRRGDQEFLAVTTPDGARVRLRGSDGNASVADLVRQLRSYGPEFTTSGLSAPLTELTAAHEMAVLPGIEVLKKVDNPMGVTGSHGSVAYELRGLGKTWWYLWEVGASGLHGAQTTRVAGDGGYESFEDWLADQKPQARW